MISSEDILMISQPEELKVDLYQHQLASVYQMEKREREQQIIFDDTIIETNIGINADTTGYGKTLSMITLIMRDKMKWDLNEPFTQSCVTTHAGGRIKKSEIKRYNKLDTTLVLANQSIIHQWYKEFQKSPVSVAMITSRKLIDTTIVENYDAILVTPSMYNRLICKYFNMAWKRFIFDEPGHIKVGGMQRIITGFIWLVTATPNAIISKHKNCRTSFMYEIIGRTGPRFINYFLTIFKYLIIKNPDNFVQKSFLMPPTHHHHYKCYNPIYKTVSRFVTPLISEMISAGNIQGALKALGGGETKNIAELVRLKKLDELEVYKTRLQILEIRNKRKQIDLIKNKIERISNQIRELDQRYREILSGDCSICYDKIKEPIMEPGCQNVFCGQCLLKWLESKHSCPLCRAHINPNELIYIKNNGKGTISPESENKTPKTKIKTVINLIRDKPLGKFIIFSAWDETFAPIRNTLSKNNIGFIEVRGNVNSRVKNINDFRNGNINVIFLNSRFNGSGINLQEATDIIVYHRMKKTTLNQIIGRANRIGRTKPLDIHHLQI